MTGDSLATRGDTPINLWHNNLIAGTLPARKEIMLEAKFGRITAKTDGYSYWLSVDNRNFIYWGHIVDTSRLTNLAKSHSVIADKIIELFYTGKVSA